MTVTKQQQLEWLANKADSWGDDRAIGYMMSLDEVGFVVGLLTRLTGIELLAGHSHIITREEWQQEREKMQKQQGSSWHERGELPQIGCECEVFADGCEPESCIILAIHNGTAAVKWSKFNNGGLDVITLNGWSFRPLRTEREMAIDEMSLLAIGCEKYAITQNTAKAVCELLYDAGFRMVKP